MDPYPRGPDWMPITPKTGSLFHAESHFASLIQVRVTAPLQFMDTLATSASFFSGGAWTFRSNPNGERVTF